MWWSCDVGEVSTDGERTIRWTIPRYAQTPEETDTALLSPDFTFRGEEECHLAVYPYGTKGSSTEGWMGVHCWVRSLPPPGSTATFCLVDTEGREILHTVAVTDGRWYEREKWIRGTDLEARSEEILPEGRLRIVCRVVLPEQRGHSAEDKEESGISSPPGSLIECPMASPNQKTGAYNEAEIAAIPIHKDTADKHPFFNQTSNTKRTDDTAVSETSLPKDVASLNQIHLHPDDDISLNDKDVEILAQILQFRYSGAIPEISPENTTRLLYIAEKCGATNLMKLMSLDVDSMMSAMTDDTICDIIRLAQLKGHTELLERATRLYEETVVPANEWQIFSKDYMADANQLRLETLERRRFVKRKKVIPNDFSERIYRMLVTLTCHPNNRDEDSIRS